MSFACAAAEAAELFVSALELPDEDDEEEFELLPLWKFELEAAAAAS